MTRVYGGRVSGVDWATICTRLRLDPNDQAAWEALDARIRTWAYDRLRAGRGWTAVRILRRLLSERHLNS